MTIEAVPTEPTLPFLRMNEYHILQFSFENSQSRANYNMSFPIMLEDNFKKGRYKKAAYILDVNCWKFPIYDVLNLGSSCNLLGLLRNPFVKRVRVKYIYGTPVKMTFDEAREEVVELICRKIWFSKTQDRESQKSFRARMAKCENMHDFIVGRRDPDPKGTYIGGIHSYGEWVG